MSDPVESHARVFSSIIGNALALSKKTLNAVEVKMYLPFQVDRAWGRRFADALTRMPVPFNVSMRGGWLHLVWEE